MITFDILTLFPRMFDGWFTAGIPGRALEKGLVDIRITDIRDYSLDKHRKTDDLPFGGGAGMVLTPQPIFDALEAVSAEKKRKIYLSPRERLLDQGLVEELACEEEIVLLLGHYEGVDQRVLDAWDMEEVSIGDYILSGGEPACAVLVDAVIRRLPGALGNPRAHDEESFSAGLLEHDQYTRPRIYQGLEVPEVLYGGNHAHIQLWKWRSALERTRERRPDLWAAFLADQPRLSKRERALLKELLDEPGILEE